MTKTDYKEIKARLNEIGEKVEWIHRRLAYSELNETEDKGPAMICPKCKTLAQMPIDPATHRSTCGVCGIHWDKNYLIGWNEARVEFWK